MIDKITKLVQRLKRHKVEYLFIGKSGAILYGYPGTTQDIDIFPKKFKKNGMQLVKALKEIGFELDKTLEEAIIKGKDFIQIRGGPFPLDLIFAPDGIQSFDVAWKRSRLLHGRFPCASLDDIIASKRSAKRQRDIEELPRLEAFRNALRK